MKTKYIFFGFFILLSNLLYAQPANDQCSGAQTVIPNGACVAGTTVAASDNWTGAVGCQSGGNAANHNDVWYTFTSTGSLYTGTITSSAPFAGNIEFVLVSSPAGCAGPFTIVGSACGASPLNISIAGLVNGNTYYFTVSNQGNGTPGPFSVCSTTSAPPCTNNTCATPLAITYTTGVQTCISDCNTGSAAGPDFTGSNCYDYPNETNWYQVTTGASTASIDILLTSGVLNNPYFTVFTTTDCLNYTIINCTQGASGSASETVMVSANTTYLIAVSDANGVDGNYNLCVTVNDDNSACNTNNSLVVTATSMGSPLTGPYQPSEIVTFRYTITDWQQINCNYLQGIVPEFGDCWDPVSFNAQGQPVNIPVPLVTAGVIQPCDPGPPCAWNGCVGTPSGTWSWFAAGQVTYNNITGSLPPNSAMPAGWYFLSSYNPATGACNGGDPTDPDNSFGDGNFPACGTNTLDWTVTFQLQARNAISGCSGSLTDCHVTIRTYADGEIGVWNNIGCTADASGAGAISTNLCCTTAPTVTTPVTYCQGAVASPLSATGTGLLWYTTPTGGVGSSTAPTPSTAVVGTTNYYVSQTNGGCESGRSLIAVTIYTPATANANADQLICANSTATLAGSVGGSAVSGTWSGGSGTYSPNANTLNAIYTPSAAEITAGSVTLTLTSNDPAGPCGSAVDQLVITINPLAIANANVDQVICSGSTVTLAGLVGGSATSGSWSGGSGTYAPNANTLNAVYTPSAGEISAGSVTLTLTTNDPAGPCGTASDQMVITINPPATANANVDQVICAGSTFNLAGIVGGSATSGSWSGGTGTYNPNANTLTAVYTPSAAEVTAGTVTLTLTTNDPAGPCGAATDQMLITINTPAIANANSDQTICQGNTVTLAGSISGSAASGTWSGGTGTFTPNATTLNAVYTPSAGDILAGSVTLTLTTDNPAGPCNAVSDQMIINITPLDNASFSYASSTYCQTGTDPSATITGLGGGVFSSTAGLVFLSTATGLIDLSASTLSSYVVTYTTNGSCPNSSTFNITITTAPSASFSYAGPFCQYETNPLPSFGVGASAGTFSSTPAGLNFVSTSTGQINLTTSAPGTYNVTNSIAAAGGCAAANFTTSVTINQAPTANANIDQTICAGSTVALAGVIGGSATSGSWSGGTGTYAPNASTLNAIYTPSPSEVTAGSVTLTLTTDDPAGPCSSVTDQLIITINEPVTVNAGIDQVICEGSTISLSGIIGGSATSGTWSGGGGTFFPNSNDLNAVYTPSGAEVTAGLVSLTLTTNDPAGPCGSLSDIINITINPQAVVNAGSDLIICAGSTATLSGSISGGITTGTWSGGTGTFSPNATSLTAVYTPSATDISNGSVTLTLTSDDPSGPCGIVTDQMVITINTPAIVNANIDMTICEGNDASLAGSVGGSASGGTWTGGTGTFTPDANTLTAIYTPSAGDILAGSVLLTLTTNDPAGPCPSVTDQMTITINQMPLVNANVDQTICTGSNVTLAGSVGGSATSGTWTGGAGIFAPDANTLNAVYTPTSTEEIAGTVTLILTTDDPSGPCPAATDQLIVTINPQPTVYADVDQVICSGSDVILNGTIGGSASNASWSGGTGTFVPDANTLNATYSPSASEITAGIVTLTLTTDDPTGPCNAVSDQINITIDQAVLVNANVDQTICEGSTVTLDGIIGGGASTGTWSGGTGTFSPNEFTLNAVYTPSAAEITVGSVLLTLTTDDPIGPCGLGSDQIMVTITPSDNASFTYSSSTQCQTGIDPAAIISGLPGGTFTSSAGLVFLDSNTGLIDLSASTLGLYVITYTTNGPCPNSSTFNINLTDAPSADFIYNEPFCQGNSNPLPVFNPGSSAGVFSSTSGLNFVNNLSGEINIATSNPGTYVVTNLIVASGGCAADTAYYTITILPNPTANAGVDQTICANSSAMLNGVVGNGANSGSWSGGNGTFNPDNLTLTTEYTPSATEIANGLVTLILTTDDPSGPCINVYDTVIINISPMDNASFGYASFNYCQYGVNPIPSIGGLIGGTFTSTAGMVFIDSLTGQIDLTNSTPGSYNITYSTSGSCPNSSTFNLTINNLPIVSAGSDTIINCLNTSISLQANSSATNALFVWSGPGILSGDSTSTPVVNVAGNYIVTVLDSLTGCLSTDSLIVSSDFSLPDVFAGNDTVIVCAIPSITLTGYSNTLGATFNWTGNGIVSGGTTPNPTINTAGEYICTVLNPINGCTNSDTVAVTSTNVPPVINAGNDVFVCNGQSANLNVTGGITYIWSPSTGLSATNISNPIATPLVNTTYTVTATDAIGCTGTDDVTVGVYPIPQIDFSVINASCEDKLDGSAAAVISNAVLPITYIWSNGQALASIDNLAIGNYSLTIVDANNCTAEDSLVITNQNLETCLEIPSVFSPNDDGKNDKFGIKNIGIYTGVKVEIYNRWNDLIYKSDNYESSSNWWDGKCNGKDMPLGSYVYILIIPDREPIQGIISIVR